MDESGTIGKINRILQFINYYYIKLIHFMLF